VYSLHTARKTLNRCKAQGRVAWTALEAQEGKKEEKEEDTKENVAAGKHAAAPKRVVKKAIQDCNWSLQVTNLLLHMENLAVFWDSLDLVLRHGA